MGIGTLRKALVAGASALMIATLAAPAPAEAGALRVDPVRLSISADRRTATVTVRNDERTPVTIRAYALTWDQADGEDRYGETDAVIVSPPIFTIAPGATQLVRVGLRSPAAGGRAYRVIVEEVPGASPAGGVQVALRLNLPLFAMMEAGAQSDIRWSGSRRSDGSYAVEAVNRGAGYVRIETSDAASAIGVAEEGAPFGVVLPNSRRRWVVAAPTITDQARFAAIVRAAQSGGAQVALARD
jgi:fimbrial chaperone protein